MNEQSIKDITIQIRELERSKEKYEECKERIRISVLLKSSKPRDIVVQESFSGDKMVDCQITMEEVESKLKYITEQITELQAMKEIRIKLIEQEKRLFERIVYMKEHNSSLNEISTATGYSISTIRRILKEFYEK